MCRKSNYEMALVQKKYKNLKKRDVTIHKNQNKNLAKAI